MYQYQALFSAELYNKYLELVLDLADQYKCTVVLRQGRRLGWLVHPIFKSNCPGKHFQDLVVINPRRLERGGGG